MSNLNADELNVRLKRAMNPRLRIAVAAEASNFLAAQSRDLTKTELGVALVAFSWTLGRGKDWQPMGTVAYSQFAQGIGLAWPSPATGRTVSRALDGLRTKGVLHRIWKASRQPISYHLGLIEDVIQREHQHHEDDPDRDDADDALADLRWAEEEGERKRVSALEATRPVSRVKATRSRTRAA